MLNEAVPSLSAPTQSRITKCNVRYIVAVGSDTWFLRQPLFSNVGESKYMKQINYIHDFQEWEKTFTFSHPIKVRFSETDMFGHLNNTVPFVYFEEARIEFFKSIGFMQKWTDSLSEEIPVVADLQCDFLQQVFFGEQLSLYVKVHYVGNSSVDLHYMAKKDNGTVAFVGRGMMVQISKKTGKSVPWNDEMRQTLIRQQSSTTSITC
jgi:acyl-CoA thioester hydrolase